MGIIVYFAILVGLKARNGISLANASTNDALSLLGGTLHPSYDLFDELQAIHPHVNLHHPKHDAANHHTKHENVTEHHHKSDHSTRDDTFPDNSHQGIHHSHASNVNHHHANGKHHIDEHNHRHEGREENDERKREKHHMKHDHEKRDSGYIRHRKSSFCQNNNCSLEPDVKGSEFDYSSFPSFLAASVPDILENRNLLGAPFQTTIFAVPKTVKHESDKGAKKHKQMTDDDEDEDFEEDEEEEEGEEKMDAKTEGVSEEHKDNDEEFEDDDDDDFGEDEHESTSHKESDKAVSNESHVKEGMRKNADQVVSGTHSNPDIHEKNMTHPGCPLSHNGETHVNGVNNAVSVPHTNEHANAVHSQPSDATNKLPICPVNPTVHTKTVEGSATNVTPNASEPNSHEKVSVPTGETGNEASINEHHNEKKDDVPKSATTSTDEDEEMDSADKEEDVDEEDEKLEDEEADEKHDKTESQESSGSSEHADTKENETNANSSIEGTTNSNDTSKETKESESTSNASEVKNDKQAESTTKEAENGSTVARAITPNSSENAAGASKTAVVGTPDDLSTCVQPIASQTVDNEVTATATAVPLAESVVPHCEGVDSDDGAAAAYGESGEVQTSENPDTKSSASKDDNAARDEDNHEAAEHLEEKEEGDDKKQDGVNEEKENDDEEEEDEDEEEGE
uniref:Uncharacterized protein n=2 Tax=Babesia bovis TaxID=5865 RepID=A7ASA8_BABBO|eukprot:XP_001610995.1 hypothetical protein [Babesia bovis T2Bo]